MATTPDSHPDSVPAGPSEDIERISPDREPGRESIEDTPDNAGGLTESAGHGGRKEEAMG